MLYGTIKPVSKLVECIVEYSTGKKLGIRR